MSHRMCGLSRLALLFVTFLVCSSNASGQTTSIPIGQYFLVRIDGRTDVLRIADHKLERLDGRTLGSIWKRSLTSEDQPSLAKLKIKDDDLPEYARDPTSTLRYIRRILTT